MTEITDSKFPSSAILAKLGENLSKAPETDRKSQIKKTNAVFELHLKNKSGESAWTIDLKDKGEVYKGKAKTKADAILTLDEDVFKNLAGGTINGQKAFMTGKLKVKGNMMLATKLDGILKQNTSKL
ncbi:sterol-binding-like protein [Wallemia mellicola CBS 633.66]|uniref:Sterol-binding-like protein n=2 Tax=Wallemia mellicola TaxID=1708541 RepID=A0A4T0QKK7_9BASI|nr:sterol-binding-like protein [Wallemia mellicola CBS 633.66]TIB72287.1 hypothetical protein E3Q23_03473 [Wallemia mellicola]EIM21411.1 sterol-binding-like protein [Wallemia mellicola CBS 633.66]TIB88203.1 sterol-binding-like protein [Wallemia mellicola]TIB95658.1 sterol-binding-like protein [Wallemia mellicola]TIB97072.1 sterol-binding-like protein [Wallemia mellicola]|eukprot:XP_006958442.1 sterol-binding-like protein [Wallemia mellicola CBS 633.66]